MADSNLRTPRLLGLSLAVGLTLGLALSVGGNVRAAAMACDDPSNFCLTPTSGAKWQADQSVSAKDKKKRNAKAGGSLSMSVDGGRGSLFVNGRYAGTAPLSGITVPSGPNDVQVRDGATVLSQGVLWVPKGGSLSVTVHHP